MIYFKRMLSNTFGSDLHIYPPCAEMMQSQTLSLHHDTQKKTRQEEIPQILEAEEHTFTSGFPHRKEEFEI